MYEMSHQYRHDPVMQILCHSFQLSIAQQDMGSGVINAVPDLVSIYYNAIHTNRILKRYRKYATEYLKKQKCLDERMPVSRRNVAMRNKNNNN